MPNDSLLQHQKGEFYIDNVGVELWERSRYIRINFGTNVSMLAGETDIKHRAAVVLNLQIAKQLAETLLKHINKMEQGK